MGSPPPKSPSSLVKVSRWSLLGLGIFYGKVRYDILKTREDKLRAIEEAERPAREAAMKADRDRKNQEEMAYLAQQAGVTNKAAAATTSGGGTSRGGTTGSTSSSACGCQDPCKEKKNNQDQCSYRSGSDCDCRHCR